MSSTKDKGKARAPLETDPLLPSSSSSSHPDNPRSSSPSLDSSFRPHGSSSSSALKSHLLTASYILLTILLAILLFLLLLASTYAPALLSLSSDNEVIVQAVEWRGPENVRVLNVTEGGGIWVEASGWVGIDTDRALGFGKKEEKEEGGMGWWEGFRRQWARKAVESIQQANVSFPTPFLVTSPSSSQPLVSISPHPSHILVPLTPRLQSPNPPVYPPLPHHVPAWLTPMTLTFKVNVLGKPDEMLKFAKNVWKTQRVLVDVEVQRVGVGGVGDWLGKLGKTKEGVSLKLDYAIPRLPNLPYPPPTNLTDIIHLDSYSVHRSTPPSSPVTASPPKLILDASASIPNLVQGIAGHFPFEIDFQVGVVLPKSDGDGDKPEDENLLISSSDGKALNRIAVVHTLPLSLNPTAKNIPIYITGEILPPPPPSNSTPPGESPLGNFVRSYLASQPLPLVLTHLPKNGSSSPSRSSLPKPISDILSAITPLMFPVPPPNPPIHLIRSVTIEDMRISTGGKGKRILASGTVLAEAQLPEHLIGKGGLDIDVKRITPNVLVLNGPVPSPTDTNSDDPPSPSIPPTAFARLHPADPIPAFTSPHPTLPSVLLLRAPFKDLPLEILSDRQLSGFVGKIILKGGAAAGIEGVADVGVLVEGLGDRVLEVNGVKVEGEVWVGRQ